MLEGSRVGPGLWPCLCRPLLWTCLGLSYSSPVKLAPADHGVMEAPGNGDLSLLVFAMGQALGEAQSGYASWNPPGDPVLFLSHREGTWGSERLSQTRAVACGTLQLGRTPSLFTPGVM